MPDSPDENAERATVLAVTFDGGVTGKTESAVKDAVFAASPPMRSGPSEQPLPVTESSATIPVRVGRENRMGVVTLVYKGWLDFDKSDFRDEVGARSTSYREYSVQHVP